MSSSNIFHSVCEGKVISNSRCEEMISKAYKKRIKISNDKRSALFEQPGTSKPVNVDIADNGGPLIGLMSDVRLKNALVH